MTQMKPLVPDATEQLQKELRLEEAKKIPNFVVNTFNRLIARGFDKSNNTSIVYKREVVAKILDDAEAQGIKVERNEIYTKHWLDVEPLFEEVGWSVRFNKQPYYETADDFFTFKRR